MRAWLRWGTVGGYDDPEAWVRRVAHNLAVSRWRKARKLVLRASVPVAGTEIPGQTIPILALAPMIVVILNQFDITGILPKAVIAAYLSFFPVTVGMVKGLRSPDPLQLDLMRTYCATRAQTFLKLRAPASAPFFFASMKIGVAAALVGAVVAEVTKSEDGGLGARLLAGSYYGQTVQIWAALFAAAALSATLVGLIGVADRIVSRRMGFAR